MKLTPLEIESHQFGTSLRGYDRDEVRAFLSQLSLELTHLLRDHAALQEQVTQQRERLSQTEGYEERLRDAMLAATQLRERSRDDAEREAQVIIREAQLRAEELIARGQSELRELQSDALSLKAQRARAAAELRATLESHLKLLAHYEVSLEEEREERRAELSALERNPRPSRATSASLSPALDPEALAQAEALSLSFDEDFPPAPAPQTPPPPPPRAPTERSVELLQQALSKIPQRLNSLPPQGVPSQGVPSQDVPSQGKPHEDPH
jgi:cell division initiation protein